MRGAALRPVTRTIRRHGFRQRERSITGQRQKRKVSLRIIWLPVAIGLMFVVERVDIPHRQMRVVRSRIQR